MRLTILLIVLLLFSPSLLSSEPNLLVVLKKGVSKDIFWLLDKKPGKSEIIKRLKKADLKEGKKSFYALDGHKYSLAISYDGFQKLSYLSYRAKKGSLKLHDFMRVFKSNDFGPFPEEGHEKGRFLAATDARTGIRVIIKNNSKKQLYRIQYRKDWVKK